jgi:hypothetical protein
MYFNIYFWNSESMVLDDNCILMFLSKTCTPQVISESAEDFLNICLLVKSWLVPGTHD